MSPNLRTCLALIGATAFVTTSALAAPSSVDVSYVRADLSKPQAAQVLYKRIQFAARNVCHEPESRELTRYAAYRRCYDTAVETAVANVDATALTALHRSRTQRTAAG
jgi:UrcA family protein